MTELKSRKDLHLTRKIYHVLGVSFILGLYNFLDREQSLGILIAVMAVFVPLDYIRRNVPALQKITFKIFGPVLRDEEKESLSGMAYMLIGIFITVYFFPPEVVNLALLLLGIGDPISSLVGIRIGKDRLVGNKSLQGTFAGFLACAIVGFLYYLYSDIMLERIVLVSILTGLIGAAAETIPIGKLDDNLTIPVVSSALLQGLFYLFGGF